MPKREQTFRCFCESCQAGPRGLDGEPLGVVFPVSQRVSHLARVKAEHEALLAPSPTTSPLSVDPSASVFAHAIIDDGRPLNSQANRLWSSRSDYQKSGSLSSSPPDISEDCVGAIVECIERLTLSTSLTDVVDQTERMADIEPTSSLPSAGPSASEVPLSAGRREKKRERNHYTRKAHCTLDHVERGINSCLDRLILVNSNTELKVLESEFALLRQAFEGVTRRVPSVDARRAAIRQILLEVETKMQGVQASYPSISDGPLIYDTSTLISLKQIFMALLTSVSH